MELKDIGIDYWTNEVLFQMDEYYKNHDLKEDTEQVKRDIAERVAMEIIFRSEPLWDYIVNRIWDLLDDFTYNPNND